MNFLPGLTDWVVMDKDMNEYKSYDQVPEVYRRNITPGLFRPSPNDENLSAEIRKSMRFLPHLNNDGGFFVAILRKRGPLPWEAGKGGDNNANWRMAKKKRMKLAKVPAMANHGIRELWQPVDQIHYLTDGSSACDQVRSDLEFHGLGGLVESRQLCSLSGGKKILRYTNATVKDWIKSTLLRTGDLNMYHFGTEFLAREGKSVCSQAYRIKGGKMFGAKAFALGAMSRKMELTKDDLLTMLQSPVSLIWNDDDEDEKKCEDEKCETPKLTPDCVRQLKELGVGSVKFTCKLSDDGNTRKIELGEDEERVECLAYVGRSTLSLRVMPAEIYHCRLLLQDEEEDVM